VNEIELNVQKIQDKLSSIVIVDAENKFQKQNLDKIIELSKEINVSLAADEVLKWLINNVNQFIDNKEKVFRIDFVIDESSNEDIGEIKKLQDLYRSIPEDADLGIDNLSIDNFANIESEILDDVSACRNMLNDITEQIHKQINTSSKLKDLFSKMIYFYEMVGINKGTPLIKNLKGSVEIVEFEYEAFSVGVQVLGGFANIDEDISTPTQKREIKKYTIPEGFSILLEISFVDKSKIRSLF